MITRQLLVVSQLTALSIGLSDLILFWVCFLLQEFLLKRTTGLSAIARAGAGKVLADPDARGYALAVLDELNVSTPITFKHKEKGAAAAAMALLAPSALQVLLYPFPINFCQKQTCTDPKLFVKKGGCGFRTG